MRQVKNAADILDFTQDMWVSVVAEQWEGLDELQQEQDAMLRRFFSVADFVPSGQDTADLLEVQNLNKKILSAAELHRVELAKELQSMKAGKVKVSAYQDI